MSHHAVPFSIYPVQGFYMRFRFPPAPTMAVAVVQLAVRVASATYAASQVESDARSGAASPLPTAKTRHNAQAPSKGTTPSTHASSPRAFRLGEVCRSPSRLRIRCERPQAALPAALPGERATQRQSLLDVLANIEGSPSWMSNVVPVLTHREYITCTSRGWNPSTLNCAYIARSLLRLSRYRV